MTKFTQKIFSTLISAAIVANVALLWKFNERLARIESKIEIILGEKHLSQNERQL
jgi:hypothetical protein